MARIPYPDPATLPEEVATLLGKSAPLNVFRMMAHAPTAIGPFMRFGNALLLKGELDPLLREMAILRVGHLSGAAYEVQQHERIARQLAMPAEKIAALAQGPAAPVFDAVERAVLVFTDDVVAHVKAGPAAWDGVRAHLSDREVLELTLSIGFYMMVSRVLETFGVDLEDDATPTLDLRR